MQLQQVNRRRTTGFILAEHIIHVAGASIFALLALARVAVGPLQPGQASSQPACCYFLRIRDSRALKGRVSMVAGRVRSSMCALMWLL